MPKFRSITLSVVSNWEFKLHPEYPHPHSEKLRIPNSDKNLKKKNNGWDDGEEEVQEYAYEPSIRFPAQVSVYIPSCPATRFWIRYEISPDHPPTKLFYFKMFMNGRHITSWGTNPANRPSGQVMRALFNPDFEENGHGRFRPAGIQSRPFLFAPETENEVALDGGLIEIKCFRSSGRKLRAADPGDFRGGQEEYGLDLPKGKLLDCPQDARFYDWLLVDPKDKPYASFKFHYRSWEHLVALSLIPPSLPRTLLTRTSSMWSISKEEDSRIRNDFGQTSVKSRQDSESRDESTLKLDTSGSSKQNQSKTRGTDTEVSHRPSRNSYTSDRPPTPFAMFSNPSHEDASTERMFHAPLRGSRLELRRTSSQVSTANSITPSLHSYLDRESNSESPEPFIGVAAAVPVLYASPNYDDSYVEEGYSLLSVESPQRPSAPLGSYGITRPPEAMFSPETVAALRKNRGDSDFIPDIQPTRIPMATFYSDRFKIHADHEMSPEELVNQAKFRAEYDSHLGEEEDTTIGVAESDWDIRTPSPNRSFDDVRVQGVWSPDDGAVEDLDGPYQSSKEAVQYVHPREQSTLPLPMPRPQARPDSRRGIRTWI